MNLHRLPHYVLYAYISVVVVAVLVIIAIFSSGSIPPRESSGYIWVILPLALGVFLLVMTFSFVISGNTLMHHYRTGTVQRATDPTWFWWIVKVQSLIAVVLLVIGTVQWFKLHG
jgi:hypothetical protein